MSSLPLPSLSIHMLSLAVASATNNDVVRATYTIAGSALYSNTSSYPLSKIVSVSDSHYTLSLELICCKLWSLMRVLIVIAMHALYHIAVLYRPFENNLAIFLRCQYIIYRRLIIRCVCEPIVSCAEVICYKSIY